MNRISFKNTALKLKKELIEGITYKAKYKGLDLSVENLAYMWFVRLIAVRFMQANTFIDCSSKDIIFNKSKFISICNYLSEVMPDIFEKLDDTMVLLLPDNMFGENSIAMLLVEGIEEWCWKIDVNEEITLKLNTKENKEIDEMQYGIEIVGWLHQYYFSTEKSKIFSELKKEKLGKDNIPTATQIFTPKWIVQYMVQNSLGRLWLESNFNYNLLYKWKYFIKGDKEELGIKQKMHLLRKEGLKPENIKIIDPAMGSGHILAYAFDLLYDIYLSYGYEEQTIPLLILEKNLYGLDIDDSVSKLASFAVLMKARSKNKKILDYKPMLNLLSIQESNDISKEIIDHITNMEIIHMEYSGFKKDIEYLVRIFYNAKEYGSLLDVDVINFNRLEAMLRKIRDSLHTDILESCQMKFSLDKLQSLVNQGKIMSQTYDVVVANPPYSGLRKLSSTLRKFVEEKYRPYKYDLFSVFMIKNMKLMKSNGIAGFMTPNVWQYISSYENLRNHIIDNYQILSLIQLEEDGFKDASVSISTFVLRKCSNSNKSIFIKLYKDDKNRNAIVEKIFSKENKNMFNVDQRMFKRIPKSKMGFWVGDKTIKSFGNGKPLEEIGKPRQGMATSDNNRFLRYWYEINIEDIYFHNRNSDIGNYKWVPYNKGGGNRKWYGNNITVINWHNNGYEVKEHAKSLYGNYTRTIKNENFYFNEGITYTFIGRDIAPRFSPEGFIFDVAGSMIFVQKDKLYYTLGLLGSKLSKHYMDFLNPSLNIQVGDIKSIPVIETLSAKVLKQINNLVIENIEISKNDWDSYETSWDFTTHPILKYKGKEETIRVAYKKWRSFTDQQFNKLKENEEKLNRLFIDIYDLKNELTPEVSDKCITITKANEEREIKSFISYAIGCMFGRYSLNRDGLIYAGGSFKEKFNFTNNQWYVKFGQECEKSYVNIVHNNSIPVSDDLNLDDNIVNRFVEFIRIAFGSETLEENLNYVARILDKKSGEPSRQIIKSYLAKGFYANHLLIYKNKPIYRLVIDKKGYEFLTYIHRHNELHIGTIYLEDKTK